MIKENLKKQIFITGTDTEVGKTFIAKLLAEAFLSLGYKVGYYKPIETGCDPICNDTFDLVQLTGQPYEEALLYQFKTPAAPLSADMKEKKGIDIDKLVKHYENLKKKYNILIVEGAGGLLVPITKSDEKIYTYLDFIKMLNIPVLIVARATLGTINHTSLTVKALKEENIEIKGIVLNRYPKNPDWATETNSEIISLMTGIKKILKIPLLDGDVPKEIKEKLMFLL